jgi:hypothetical protein
MKRDRKFAADRAVLSVDKSPHSKKAALFLDPTLGQISQRSGGNAAETRFGMISFGE